MTRNRARVETTFAYVSRLPIPFKADLLKVVSCRPRRPGFYAVTRQLPPGRGEEADSTRLIPLERPLFRADDVDKRVGHADPAPTAAGTGFQFHYEVARRRIERRNPRYGGV